MPIIPVALLAVAAVGVGASVYEQAKANSASNAALKFQEQQANLQASLQQRQAIRTSRIAYANSQQEAANQGVGDSSASQGGLGSIQSQLNSNLSFLDQYNRLSDAAGKKIGEANTDRMWAGAFSEIGNFAGSLYGHEGQIKSDFAQLFGGGKQQGSG